MINYAMFSACGDRAYNDDYVKSGEKEDSSLFLLADGLGGMGCGAIASQTSVDLILEKYQQEEDTMDSLTEYFKAAQERVLAHQKLDPEMKNMSTTLVALYFRDRQARWAHIGDSRLYRFRDGQIRNCTVDHSVPQMLVNLGEITHEDIPHHPDRNRLLRAIGQADLEKVAEVSQMVPLKSGDAFLLCTDGFWEYIPEALMCSTLKEAKDVVAWLNNMKNIVIQNGKDSNMDNFSALAVWIE